jgi:D-alanine-D-alanine ligase
MTIKKPALAKRRAAGRARACLGPVADLESHLPQEWWRELFDSLYLMTDGDVVENDINTVREVDTLIAATGITKQDRILDLCCGQGRHVLELARRGYQSVKGIDRSGYLVRLARRRAQEAGLTASFLEGDARKLRLPDASLDCVTILGNSFGYFATEEEDARVLEAVARILRSGGTLALDITDGAWIKANFEKRSWEWIDQNHFVCRERSLSNDGTRLITREVVVHDERGVIADQFYAERLYTVDRIQTLLAGAGFKNLRHHKVLEAESERAQDLGMMARRLFLTATGPRHETRVPKGVQVLDVAVVMGDPRLPDTVKREGKFGAEDFETIAKLQDALSELKGYRFRYLDNHATLERDLAAQRTDLVFNLCDEGLNNDAFMELHVPALLEMKGIPYTGAGPAALAACYDKALVRALAVALEIPVPLETYVRTEDQSATLPSTFPAILKPNFGDSSIGITKDAVVSTPKEMIAALDQIRETLGRRPILVQEFLTGTEYTVALIGNPDGGLKPLTMLEVDYSGLDSGLPPILGYESKWLPDSPYWTQIRYRETTLPATMQRMLVEYASRLFERLRCRDYARFDFRANAAGEIKLLEVNPNPGWCWDGKMNLMAGMAGLRYSEFLGLVLEAATSRLRDVLAPRLARAAGKVAVAE